MGLSGLCACVYRGAECRGGPGVGVPCAHGASMVCCQCVTLASSKLDQPASGTFGLGAGGCLWELGTWTHKLLGEHVLEAVQEAPGEGEDPGPATGQAECLSP